jgi:hypothetical protein
VFENRILRRTLRPKRNEVTEAWRKLHNKELHNLYSSPNTTRKIKSSRMRWAGHMALVGEKSKVCKVLVEKPKGRRLLRRPRHRLEDGIRMEGDWLEGCRMDYLTQDRDHWQAFVNTMMNLWVLEPQTLFV